MQDGQVANVEDAPPPTRRGRRRWCRNGGAAELRSVDEGAESVGRASTQLFPIRTHRHCEVRTPHKAHSTRHWRVQKEKKKRRMKKGRRKIRNETIVGGNTINNDDNITNNNYNNNNNFTIEQTAKERRTPKSKLEQTRKRKNEQNERAYVLPSRNTNSARMGNGNAECRLTNADADLPNREKEKEKRETRKVKSERDGDGEAR